MEQYVILTRSWCVKKVDFSTTGFIFSANKWVANILLRWWFGPNQRIFTRHWGFS